MAGVLNKTERQYNFRGMEKPSNRKVTIRLAPGFNSVDDERWNILLKSKNVNYIQRLKAEGKIDYGEKLNDQELDRQPDVISKSKIDRLPKKSKKAD